VTRSYKSTTQSKIEAIGLIPLFYHDDVGTCTEVAKVIFDAGCPIVEFTNRGKGASAAFQRILSIADSDYPDAVVGIGSVHDPFTAAQYISMGADFIVGPCFSEEVARLCNRHQILYVPGCATPTEVIAAAELGLDLIKIFPAGALGGADFIKAISGPFPWLKTIATGGVTASKDDLAIWFGAKVAAVGLGSDLISKEVLTSKKYDTLATKISELLETIAVLKAKI